MSTAGQTHTKMGKNEYLGGCNSTIPDLLVDITRRMQRPGRAIRSMDATSTIDPAPNSDPRSEYLKLSL